MSSIPTIDDRFTAMRRRTAQLFRELYCRSVAEDGSVRPDEEGEAFRRLALLARDFQEDLEAVEAALAGTDIRAFQVPAPGPRRN